MTGALPPPGRFVVPAGHPCLPGHFPGRPVVPGVVLLDEVLALAGSGSAAGFPSVRFVRPVRPGEVVEVVFAPAAGGWRFEGRVGGQVALQGSVALAGPMADATP